MLSSASHGLREFVIYRHPDPRRGEPKVCSTQLDVFPLDPVESSRSGAELQEAHLEARSFGTFGRKMGTILKLDKLLGIIFIQIQYFCSNQ